MSTFGSPSRDSSSRILGLQCLVFLKFRFEVLQLALQTGFLCLQQLRMNVLRPGRRGQLIQRSSELLGVSSGDERSAPNSTRQKFDLKTFRSTRSEQHTSELQSHSFIS